MNSILTITAEHDFAPVLSRATGMHVPPPRPACCSNPETEIAGYTAVRDNLLIAQTRLAALADDLRAVEIEAAATETAKANLTAAISAGQKTNKHEAARLDRQRQDHIAQADVMKLAITAAEGNVTRAREALRRVLRVAAEDAIDLMSQRAGEARRDAETATTRASTYQAWTRDASFALQGANTVETLLQFLGVG